MVKKGEVNNKDKWYQILSQSHSSNDLLDNTFSDGRTDQDGVIGYGQVWTQSCPYSFEIFWDRFAVLAYLVKSQYRRNCDREYIPPKNRSEPYQEYIQSEDVTHINMPRLLEDVCVCVSKKMDPQTAKYVVLIIS
jgi:hypothetical protein